jgi:peptidylprolyl isomerase
MSRPAVAALLCILAVAGCGGGSSKPAAGSEVPATASPTPTASEAVTALADGISKDRSKKPQVAIPAGATPTTFTTKDIVPGTGRKAKPGDTVSVQYVGSSWSTGSEFDASWDNGSGFSFGLGKGQVIKGWDQGVVGMRVGGRRLLVIPPALGYGANGSPPKIAANETLAFVVDLESAK